MATKNKQPKKILGWHFLPSHGCLEYGDGRKVIVGQTLTVTGTPQVCGYGLHASTRPSQAASYHRGPIMCRVEVWGDVHGDPVNDDKFCGSHRKVLWMKELTKKDLMACCKAAGISVNSNYSRDSLVSSLQESAEADFWLQNWALSNGCPDVGKVEQPKPKLTGDFVRKFVHARLIQTQDEILKAMGGRKALDSLYDADSVSEIFDNDDLSWECDVTQVDLPSGDVGYILG